MECEYGRYSPELRSDLRALAGRLGLAVTGGSDYHGRYKPDIALGTGTGDLNVATLPHPAKAPFYACLFDLAALQRSVVRSCL